MIVFQKLTPNLSRELSLVRSLIRLATVIPTPIATRNAIKAETVPVRMAAVAVTPAVANIPPATALPVTAATITPTAAHT